MLFKLMQLTKIKMKHVKKQYYTAITEFEVINPTNEMESIGEKLYLSSFGEYCPDNSLRGYSLLALLQSPENYRPSKIISRGQEYVLVNNSHLKCYNE